MIKQDGYVMATYVCMYICMYRLAVSFFFRVLRTPVYDTYVRTGSIYINAHGWKYRERLYIKSKTQRSVHFRP